MTEFAEIENAVRSLIIAIEIDNHPAFASIEGWLAVTRKDALDRIERLAQPAALVMATGRSRAATERALGDPRISVMVSARNLRSAHGPRLGDGDGPGTFALSELVTAALDGAAIGPSRRLIAFDEQVVAADARFVAIEQRWIVERPGTTIAPTFDGEAIAGETSLAAVRVGPLRAEHVEFAMPGVDGTFRHGQGARPRTIIWTGRLQAADHDALNAIEASIEAQVGDARIGPITDGFGRTFDNCVLDLFERKGPRRLHPATGAAQQDFELEFLQLSN